MAWFCNHYHCDDCGTDWQDEWSCTCDDDCPNCGSRHWSPLRSDDLTFIIEEEGAAFAIYESPIEAEHKPRYRRMGLATSFEAAQTFVAMRSLAYWPAE